MALRKEHLGTDEDQAVPAAKRSRITIDVSPELRRRIKVAAVQNDLSIGEYLGNILEHAVPEDASMTQQRRPATRRMVDNLRQVREENMRDRGGKLFEDSVELLRQQREERTRQLMGEL